MVHLAHPVAFFFIKLSSADLLHRLGCGRFHDNVRQQEDEYGHCSGRQATTT